MMKKSKRKAKSPPYTVVLTLIALIFALVLIGASVIAGNQREANGTDGTDADSGSTSSESVTDTRGETAESEAESRPAESESDTDTESETDAETQPPAPEQTIPLGIYVKTERKKYTNVTEYVSEWPENDADGLWTLDTWTYADRDNLICDVTYFSVFTSVEPEIKLTYWDETWVELWDENVTDESAKIGFELTVCLKNGETLTETVLSPADTFVLEKYFELYLYDCVAHAHDSWYSHITEKTNYEDTRNVEIKITLRNGCYDVERILLTAFVYTPDELDENGRYTGANKATCTVKRN